MSGVALGETALGIELGSTRIKAVLIGPDCAPLAQGSHQWESRRIDGVWTYSILDIWSGLRACYADLARDMLEKHGQELTTVGSIGVSAMMHGYMPFDREKILLTPFRTWRNTITGPAAAALSAAFGVNIPQRWTVAHLYQAMLNGEEHLPRIDYLTTLAGYVHWRLTGFRSVGVGEGSGIFPLDPATGQYDRKMLDTFAELSAAYGLPWSPEDILPEVLRAGENAGWLTAEGARMLDSSGRLQPGIPFCPPEGDAETGMVATNCIAPRTANVSAGTSIFSMTVLEKPLKRPHPELDIVATPEGREVAMIHCNNCTAELNAWAGLFGQFAAALGAAPDADTLYNILFAQALQGEADCGGLLAYNFEAAEPVLELEAGRPLFVRGEGSRLTLPNFLRAQLCAALAALCEGSACLREEGVVTRRVCAHGGFFKTPEVGQRLLAAALEAPVTVLETAGEGGPWGMALLAAYLQRRQPGESLEAFLDTRVFGPASGTTLQPDPADVAGFRAFLERYRRGLPLERAAAAYL